MKDNHSKQDLTRFDHGIVRRKARQIVGRAGYTQQDVECLQQELFLRILQGMRSYDPTVAHRHRYVTAIVERSVATLLRDKQAAKRDHRRLVSLHVVIDDNDAEPTELKETIGDDVLNARRAGSPRTDEELVDLAIDLAELLAQLTPRQRELAERRKTQTMTEIAREMGVPRTTLYDWMRAIRKRFENTGLKDYL